MIKQGLSTAVRVTGILLITGWFSAADTFYSPNTPPTTTRKDVFAFTEKPTVKRTGKDRYEISFAVKDYCDVTVAIVDGKGKVVRHLASGVLGPNAPKPFKKNSLKQVLVWNGKDDVENYPEHPDRMRVKVMLGLKPVFHRRLGGTTPYNIPAGVWGIAVTREGVYVVAFNGAGFAHGSIRKFDHDGRYVGTIFPPPSDMPLERLKGMSYVEYEKGKRALHGNDLHDSIAGNAGMLAGLTGHNAPYCQVAVTGERLFFTSCIPEGKILWIRTDGSTELAGTAGVRTPGRRRLKSRKPSFLAASPDGKWIYMTEVEGLGAHAVYRWKTASSSKPQLFAGVPNKPGSDASHLNNPAGIDCDSSGRVYVADTRNNRIQVFSPEGKHLKTIPMSNPRLVRINRKTGAIYVQHSVRIRGKARARLTKLRSFEKPVEEYHLDGVSSALMAVDWWTKQPRLWLGNTVSYHHGKPVTHYSLKIYEEKGKNIHLLVDFEKKAREETGGDWIGRWAADCFDKVVCDPTRNIAYYRNSIMFDLETGKLLGRFTTSPPCRFDDMAFDKRGYMHLHFNPCFFGNGVGRVDPSRAEVKKDKKGTRIFVYPEVPYDYGIEAHGWTGILPTKDQLGAKGFQDGLGVNMQGDVAEECNIYYVPKFEDAARGEALAGNEMRLKSGVWSEEQNTYNRFMRDLKNAMKRGEEVAYIRISPGMPLHGGTVWTFERSGELLRKFAVIAGDLINGVQIDEDRALYFVNARPRAYGGKPFLYGKGGIIGTKKRLHPFTGTLIKTRPDTPCRIKLARAAVPLSTLPKRPPDLMQLNFMDEAYMGKGSWCWVEGAEWLYAGAGPITSVGCSCPRQHLGLDWFKRTYLPEAYRHSIAILDTAGNLIMHLGSYGNFDEAPGGAKGTKPGGTEVKMLYPRFISATDEYLVYGDWAEKIVVLKLTYHVEESVPIPADK